METKNHPKIYRAAWWKRAAALLIFTPIMIFVTTITAAAVIDFSVRSLQEQIWWGYLLSAPFIVFTIVGWWLYWHGIFVDRLEISEEGIVFYSWGYNGWIRWQNLVNFDYRWIYFRTRRFFSSKRHRLHRYWGIRLKAETETSANWIQKLLLIPSIHDQFLPLQYWVHIPRKSLLDREMDIERFKQTSLGQDLLYYAPHLFEDET